MIVRTGSDADSGQIARLDPLVETDAERAQLVAAALRAGDCLVAAEGSEVLGFAIFNYGFFGQGFVPLLVVRRDKRRCGIGTALIAEAERRCRKPKLFTSANASNLEAQGLLRKCGFVPSGRIENLDTGDDELVYFKRLGG